MWASRWELVAVRTLGNADPTIIDVV